MIETLNQFAAESLADSFETMAFISPMPAEDPSLAPVDAVLLSIAFAGNCRGVVEMVAPRALGKLAASNMLGLEEPSAGQCEDALKELLNIFGGLTLRRWSAAAHERPNMSLPKLSEFDSGTQWGSFISSSSAIVLDVEGNAVALRVREADESERT